MPGRKRPTKKQSSSDRVNSEVSLNGGDTTSESESESLLVSWACSQTATIDSGNPNLHSLALSTTEKSNHAPTSDCLQSYASANEDTHTLTTDRSARGSTSPKTYVSPPRLQRFDITPGSGDEMEVHSNQIASFDTVLHSFLSRVESQGEASIKAMRECIMAQCKADDKVMRECMSARTEVIRDWVMAQNEANSQMMRDCMSSMTLLVKENNSLLLKGLLDLGSKVESLCSHKTTSSSSNATSLQASITLADKRDSQPAFMFLTPAVDPQSPQTSTQACTAHVPKDTTDTSFNQPEITSDASRSGTIAYIQSDTDARRSINLSSPCILSCADSTKTHNVKLPIERMESLVLSFYRGRKHK